MYTFRTKSSIMAIIINIVIIITTISRNTNRITSCNSLQIWPSCTDSRHLNRMKFYCIILQNTNYCSNQSDTFFLQVIAKYKHVKLLQQQAIIFFLIQNKSISNLINKIVLILEGKKDFLS